jgi:hypothetical protein
MVVGLRSTIAPDSDLETTPESPPDLETLAESAISLGSYGLRWQLLDDAAGGTQYSRSA